jgi:signal transduction histidine kinase
MIYILARKARQSGDGIYWAPTFFFVTFVFILLLRLGIWLLAPELRGLFTAATTNNTFFLSVLLHDIGIAVSYLMLNSKRRTDELLQTQHRLQHLSDSLQQRVQEETDKRLLQERVLAHNARLASMGEMLGVIAHQWRQPLSTLAMIVQRLDLRHRQGALSLAEMAEARATSMGQIRHLSETIEEFRRFYQPDRATERFLPAEACRSAISLIRPQLAGGGIHLTEQIHFPDNRFLPGYANQFKQVILNVLSNARNAIVERQRHEGSIEAGHIELHLGLTGNICRISISDDGCGIGAEAQGHIFEPFYTTRKDGDGTGIGLYLTRTIVVDGFHGRIDFESRPGHTVFTIDLPLPEPQGAIHACA